MAREWVRDGPIRAAVEEETGARSTGHGMTEMRLHAFAICPFVAVLAACSPYHFVGAAVLAGLDDEELCGRRSNLLNGELMVRELARRGTDCAPFDEAGLRRGFHLSFLSPAASPASVKPPGLPSVLEPIAPEPIAPLLPEPDPVPADWTKVGATGNTEALTTPQPSRGSPAPAPRATATAPAVTPACAQRSVQTGADEHVAPAVRHWTVAFRNTCGFPIRVRYAQRPAGSLTSVTELLRPGETSPPAPIASGFNQPGYFVCSYEAVPESTACQLRGNAR